MTNDNARVCVRAYPLTRAHLGPPAIDKDGLARHKGSQSTGQVDDRLGNLVGLANVAHQVVALGALQEGCVLRLGHAGIAVQLGDDDTGAKMIVKHALCSTFNKGKSLVKGRRGFAQLVNPA